MVSDLDKIKIPIFAMAMGWKGRNGFPDTVNNYGFSDATMNMLRRIEKDGYPLGCRDLYSEAVLKRNGINNTVMTGCAAWYDLKYVDSMQLNNCDSEIRKIYVSEPARIENFNQFIGVISFLKSRFPNAEIKAVFHRGVSADEYTSDKAGKALSGLCSKLNQMDIPYEDISFGSDKLSIYEKCDIHIGYRVHAHIYNLSQRRRSILIQEDGRGAGVNQALGLREIFAFEVEPEYKNQFIQKSLRKINLLGKPSETVCFDLDDYLTALEKENYIQFEWAFERMRYYYHNMVEHLSGLKELDK